MSETCTACSALAKLLNSQISEAYRVRDLAQQASSRAVLDRQQIEEAHDLEPRVARWVTDRMGPEHMSRKERAVRLLEEAIELAQAEGVRQDLVQRLVDHVYSRDAGKPEEEIAGVATTALGCCAAAGLKFWQVALAEIARLEQVPGARIMASLRRKEAAGLLTVRLRQHQPMEYTVEGGR